MFGTLPKGTLEVVILVNCDWEQAKVIIDGAFKTNTNKPGGEQFQPHSLTMERHPDQLRQQERETLKFLTKRRGRNAPKWSSKKHNKRNTQPQRNVLRKVSLLSPKVSFVSGPSTGTRLEATAKDRKELIDRQSMGQGSSSVTAILMRKMV